MQAPQRLHHLDRKRPYMRAHVAAPTTAEAHRTLPASDIEDRESSDHVAIGIDPVATGQE